MSKDYMEIAVPKKAAKGGDYYTNLWEKTQKARGEIYEKKINVFMTRASQLAGVQEVTLVVEVYSQMKKSRIKRCERVVGTSSTMVEIRKLAGVMGAAMSEKCSEDFGDNFNAPEYEKMAHEAFDALVKDLERGVLTMATIKG